MTRNYRCLLQPRGAPGDVRISCGIRSYRIAGRIKRRPVVSYWHDTYQMSERRACRVARLPVSTLRYESMLEPRTALRLRIREIAQTRVRYG